MRCSVIGGGGFLGSHLVRQLLHHGHEVVTLGRSPYPHLPREVRQIRGDMRLRPAVDAAVAGQDVVFLVAGVARVRGGPRAYDDVNVRGPRVVVEACRASGVRRLVLTSTPGVVFGGDDIVDGDESLPYAARPTSAYQRSKAAGERLVLAANEPGVLETVALRPHAMWGPGDTDSWMASMLRLASRRRLPIIGTGCNLMSATYVANAAHAHILAASAPGVGGRAFFINDPEPVALWSWFNGVLERVGLPRITCRLPYALAYLAGILLEWVAAATRSAPGLSRYTVDLMAHDHTFSTAAAERDLGYRPIVEPSTGMQRFVDWYARDRRARED